MFRVFEQIIEVGGKALLLEAVSTSGYCSQKLAAFDLIVWQQCTDIMPTRMYALPSFF